MTTDEIIEKYGMTEESLREVRAYSKFNRRIKSFKNNNTLATFNEIFGEGEGERLREHYFKLDFDFNKFLTYLTSNQIDLIYAYISKLED